MKYFKQIGIRKVPIGQILNKTTQGKYEIKNSDTYLSKCKLFLLVSKGNEKYDLIPNTNNLLIPSVNKLLSRKNYSETINKSEEYLEEYYKNNLL